MPQLRGNEPILGLNTLEDLQCTTLVNTVSLRPFKSAFLALELFSLSFTAFSFVGGTVGVMYPSTIDCQT
jgi:hypothetical protein